MPGAARREHAHPRRGEAHRRQSAGTAAAAGSSVSSRAIAFGRSRRYPPHSALCACTVQLVPTLPSPIVEAMFAPVMNQIATLPVPSIHRMALMPLPLKSPVSDGSGGAGTKLGLHRPVSGLLMLRRMGHRCPRQRRVTRDGAMRNVLPKRSTTCGHLQR